MSRREQEISDVSSRLLNIFQTNYTTRKSNVKMLKSTITYLRRENQDHVIKTQVLHGSYDGLISQMVTRHIVP